MKISDKAKQELLKIRTDRLKDPTKTLKIVTILKFFQVKRLTKIDSN